MATSRDWSALQWTPTQSFALPTESQLGRGLRADSGQFAESKFSPTAANLALLQSLGYTGAGLTPTGPDYGFGSAPTWSDDARTWLDNSGYTLGVAHDPGTSAGGRQEYFGLMDPSGKFVQGQDAPTTTISDTLMDQITPFLLMAGPVLGATGVIGGGVGAGTGMAGIAADGVSLGSSGLAGAGAGAGAAGAGALGAGAGTFAASDGALTSLAAQGLSPEALGLTGAITPGMSAADLAYLSQALPGAVEVGGAGLAGGGLESGGNSLVQNPTNTFWDKVQNGATKGAIKGGVTSGVQGKNPLQGALTGAVGGAIGGGISSIGDGSLGNSLPLDTSTGTAGAYDLGGDWGGSYDPNALNSVGSFAGNTGGNMGWTDWLSGLGGDGGTTDLGSFSDPGYDWNSSGYYGGNVPALNLPDYQPSEGLDWNKINQILGQTPTDVGANPGDMTGGIDPSIWDLIKNGVGSVAGAVGGGGNLAALVGAGLGAASGGGTQTQSRDPWSAAQPYLKNLLGDADTMRANLAANPFTPQQTQQYQQAYSGLDQARAALPGLLNWGQQAMQRQSTTPSYEQLFGGQPMPAQPMPGGLLNQPAPQPTMQAGGPGGLLGNDDRMKALMAKGRSLIG